MRASAITLLIATGLWALACGSGSAPNNAGPAQPLENGQYQKPSTTYQDPSSTKNPSDYQKPPSTYQGGGPSTGPGSAASPCAVVCTLAADGSCAQEGGDIASLPPDQCVAACNEALGGFPCPNEFGDVMNCLLDQGLTCGQLESIGEGNPNDIPADVRSECTESINAFAACVDAQQNPPGPGNGGDCTVGGGCACANACDSCRCENLGDDGPCTDCRPNGR